MIERTAVAAVVIGLSLTLAGCGLLESTQDDPQIERRQDVVHEAAPTTARVDAADASASGQQTAPPIADAAGAAPVSATSEPDAAPAQSTVSDPVTMSPWTGTSQPETSFLMPSENVACAMASDWVACQIFERHYTLLTSDVDPQCAPSLANTILLRESEPGRWICSDRSLFSLAETSGSELPYGESSSVGELTCQSDPDGVACTGPSGHFRLARSDYTLW